MRVGQVSRPKLLQVRGVLLPLQKDTVQGAAKALRAKNLKEEFRNEKPEAGS